MKIAIITSVSQKSSRELAEHFIANGIEARVFQPYKDNRENFMEYDHVFSYGCSAQTKHRSRLNTREAVEVCVDKVRTFNVLRPGIPIPRYWYNENGGGMSLARLPPDVQCLVVRQDRKGRKAEDMTYWYREEGKPIPYGDLYTEFFEHNREYRVTVFKDQVWVYFKKYTKADHMHTFNLQRAGEYPAITKACLQAADRIGIDYVSFDVVAKTKNDFVILEANSGTVLTEEVSTAIVEYFLNL